MNFTWLKFDDMQAQTAISLLSLRHRVFDEQGLYHAQEVDEIDKHCEHLCVYEHSHEVIACLRLYQLKDKTSLNSYQIGRICVDNDHREQGIAKKMITSAIMRGMGQGLEAKFETHTPVYLSELYRSIGFESFGDPYKESDVPHICMKLRQASLLEEQLDPIDPHRRRVRVS